MAFPFIVPSAVQLIAQSGRLKADKRANRIVKTVYRTGTQRS